MTFYDRLLAFIAAKWHISMQLLRYVISGGITALTELVFLYLFTQILGIWYIFSLLLAFIISFIVSFSLQKFWTFGDTATHRIHIQASTYLFVALINLALNAALLYLLVQFTGLWYIYSQILCDAFIAISSFLIYKFIIFERKETTLP